MSKEGYNMEGATPEKLFVCIFKIKSSLTERLDKFYAEGVPLPADLQSIRLMHLQYVYDISKRGILWLGGPTAEWTASINIFAVDSLEQARGAQQNDPYYVHGLFYDDIYFEWIIHAPLSKVAPAHRERLLKSYRDLGITPEPFNVGEIEEEAVQK
jgi:uncharacterized protein YciI